MEAQSNTRKTRSTDILMILIRYLLICVIGYLIIRAFVKFGQEKSSGDQRSRIKEDKASQKKVSKEIGEYIDYEEIKKSGGS